MKNIFALHKISYGMYVICSKDDDKINGQIANSAIQVTSEPAMLVICINKQNLTHEFISKSKVFTLSILSVNTPMIFIGTFGFKSGRNINKFEGVKYSTGITGVPIVEENSVAYLEAEVINTIDVGTHTMFVGKLIDCNILNNDEPMSYAYYHEIKKGKSPKAAPTYIKNE